MTYISDTTVPLSNIIFPSVTICNINQVKSIQNPIFSFSNSKVKQSILLRSKLPSSGGFQDYLIDYFYLGSNKSEEPVNWNETLANVVKNSGWNPDYESFNRFSAQDCNQELFMFVAFQNQDITWKNFGQSYTDYGICCKLFPQLYTNISYEPTNNLAIGIKENNIQYINKSM